MEQKKTKSSAPMATIPANKSNSSQSSQSSQSPQSSNSSNLSVSSNPTNTPSKPNITSTSSGISSKPETKSNDDPKNKQWKSSHDKRYMLIVYYKLEDKLRFYLFANRPKELDDITGSTYSQIALLDKYVYRLDGSKKYTQTEEDDRVGETYDSNSKIYNLLESIIDRKFFDQYDADTILAPKSVDIKHIDSVVIDELDNEDDGDDEDNEDNENGDDNEDEEDKNEEDE